jgi:hypothetical protein
MLASIVLTFVSHCAWSFLYDVHFVDYSGPVSKRLIDIGISLKENKIRKLSSTRVYLIMKGNLKNSPPAEDSF